jgi:hypothetical protein
MLYLVLQDILNILVYLLYVVAVHAMEVAMGSTGTAVLSLKFHPRWWTMLNLNPYQLNSSKNARHHLS